MPTRRKKKERRKVSARRRVNEHKTGWSPTCFDLPDGEKTELFNPKPGNYRIDIIPFLANGSEKFHSDLVFADDGEPYFERTIWTHRRIGADENSYVCPRKTCGLPCPICEARAKESEKSDGDEELIKALTPKERQLWNVIDLNDPDKGIQIWELSFHLFGKLLDDRVNNAEEDDEWDTFADPEDGMTLRITVSEGSMSNKYVEVTAIDFKPRKEGYDPEIIEESPQLDDLVKILEYDELKKIFLSVADDDDDEDDEDDAPKKSRRSSTKRKATSRGAKSSASKRRTKKEEVDEDDDEWDEDEDDEQEEEKPRRKSKTTKKTTTRRKKKPEPEPEEDDDEEWEEDEDLEEDEDDEEWEDDEDTEDDEDDDIPFDEDDEEEDEEEEPKPRRRRKSRK